MDQSDGLSQRGTRARGYSAGYVEPQRRQAAVTKEESMANIITDEIIDEVSILAKLELEGETRENAKKDMARMLDYVDKLNELDTTGIEPMSHIFSVDNVFREDEVTNTDEHEKTLANAPGEKNQMFKVPRTVE